MPVGELLDRISSAELTHWQALAEIRANEAERKRSRKPRAAGKRFG